jgi:predicted dehydrogenase
MEKFKEVEETVSFRMEFPGGTVSTSISNYGSPGNRLYLTAEKEWFELRPAFSYAGLKGRTSQGELNLPAVNQQAAQMDDFVTSIREKSKSNSDGEEGLKDLKVIEAIYRAAETGRTVKV